MTQILPSLFPYIPERKMFSVKYSPQCLRYKVTKLKKKTILAVRAVFFRMSNMLLGRSVCEVSFLCS